MKYYLVALFDDNSYSKIENIQKNVCRKYKLYKRLPVLHVALETIEEPDLNKLDPIISEILKPYKRFKIELKKALCFDSPCRSLNIEVENKGYIIRISRNINEKLKLHGFNVGENVNNLYIPIANTNFNHKKWETDQQFLENSADNELMRIDRIELWKTVNNKKTLVIKSYPLKEY